MVPMVVCGAGTSLFPLDIDDVKTLTCGLRMCACANEGTPGRVLSSRARAVGDHCQQPIQGHSLTNSAHVAPLEPCAGAVPTPQT
jgi:hypothetical protein